MRTPGRCTNLEGCWISASHRNVWLSIGEDFACPNCGGRLSPPLPQARSYRVVKRAASIGAVASLSLAVVGLGAVKLSTVSWPGQAVAARVVQAPGNIMAAAFHGHSDALQVADAAESIKPLSSSGERTAALSIIKARPNSIIGLQGISAYDPHPKTGPVMIYKSQGDKLAAGSLRGPDDKMGPEEQRTGEATSQTTSATVTLVSEAVLTPAASMERPVVLPISFGRPVAPETDAEPVSLAWHHHGMVAIRHSGFLPAPVAATPVPVSADTIAQICRIPSLMH